MFRKDVFEQLLLKNWAAVFDTTALLKRVMRDAQNASLKKTRAEANLRTQTKMTITKFAPFDKTHLEVWVEFTVPKDSSVVIGTHIYRLSLDGDLKLDQTIGMDFLFET